MVALRYNCNGNDIYQYVDGLPGHPGHFVEQCPQGCFDLPDGATCVDRAPPSRREAVEDKYNECTSDYRGVRTCEYGFCYVVPGGWCKANESCRNDCKCCKKNQLLSRRREQLDASELVPSDEDKSLDVKINKRTCSEYCQPFPYHNSPLTICLHF